MRGLGPTKYPGHAATLRWPGRLIVMFTAALLAGCLLASIASAAQEPEFEYLGAFGRDGTEATGFSHATSVAVDHNAGRVYVLDRVDDAVYKFDLAGSPVDFGGSAPNITGNKLSGFSIADFFGSRQIAVDSISHRFYVPNLDAKGEWGATVLEAFQANGEPALFTAGPGGGTNRLTGFQGLRGIAVDSEGNIYTSDSGKEFVGQGLSVYGASGSQLVPEKYILSPEGVAVNTAGIVYLLEKSETLFQLIPSTFPVTSETTYAQGPSVDPKPVRAVAVDPATNRVFDTSVTLVGGQNGYRIAEAAVFDEENHLEATFGKPGENGELDEPTGVAVTAEGERAFVAQAPEGGPSEVKVFRERLYLAPPSVESTGVSEVNADSATLQGRVNPNSLATTYWFEYGSEDCVRAQCARVPFDDRDIAVGKKSVPATQALTGLLASTTYHYRVVAENELGRTDGPDRTFTTQGSGLGFRLADSRDWEMVSPPDKHGGSVVLGSQGIIQAAEDGDGLAYLSLGSIEADPRGNRAVEASSVLARRDPVGWHSEDITPPHTELTVVGDAEYKLMSPDLSRAFLEARDGTPLSPLTTERTPYLRENTHPPVYAPLLTAAEGHANVVPGTEFGSEEPIYPINPMGANAGLTTVALRSEVPLLEDAPAGALYAWSNGQLQLVSQLPADKDGLISPAGFLGSSFGSVRNAISADGSRIFWAPGSITSYLVGGIDTSALYLRDTNSQQSMRLDVVKSGSGDGEERPAFQIADDQGSVVYFTDSHHLVKGASPEGRDLYRCEIPVGESAGGCTTLTDISAPRKGSGESAMVKDQVLAASEDGSRVFFAAEGILDTEPNAEGEAAAAEEPNLYLWTEGDGVRFIATLSDQDQADWGTQPGRETGGYSSTIAADASPSGRYLAFSSNRSLTGYDNETASGDLAQEAYRYDAAGDELACVSCNPTGGGPRAMPMPETSNLKVDPVSLWPGQPAAALLPEPRYEGAGDALYRPRTVLDNGRVFFNAFDSLVPADSNGTWDVYQYESTGTGSCTLESGDAATARSGDGCVSLISSGTADEEAAFLDASLSGDDVFFISTAKLSVLDEDAVYDVYDARVDGVAARLPDLSECQGEACRPQVSAPNDPTPASAGFRGAGNVSEPKAKPKHCTKGKRKVKRHGKTRCVSRKKKHRRNRSR